MPPNDDAFRERVQSAFGYVEDALYVAVAFALAVAGLGLFGYVVYDFVTQLSDGPKFTTVVLELLDGLLKPTFGDAMPEIGILTGVILGLTLGIFMLRHTEHSEPKPQHEPD